MIAGAIARCVLPAPGGFVIGGAAFVAWWRILFTGKQSATMHDAMRVSLAYSTRANAFMLLMTEYHPRLLDLPPQELPATAPAMPPAGQGQLPPPPHGQLPPADPYATPQQQDPPPPPPPPSA